MTLKTSNISDKIYNRNSPGQLTQTCPALAIKTATIHPRKFGYDVSVLRPSVHSLGVMEGNQVSARGAEEYVINRAMYLCNLRFSWRQIAQEMSWPSRRVQKRVYFRNLFSNILSTRICDRSAQFLINCFEKFLWQQTIADLIQPTCLLVSGEKRERSGKE